MTTPNRSDRQLMRQRGAGSVYSPQNGSMKLLTTSRARENGNVDFGLNFRSNSGREGRKFMRQRGAGNRQIENVEFGFAFPSPDQSRRSRSKTPQTNRRNVRRASKTPARSSREPSVPVSHRATRNRSQSASGKTPSTEILGEYGIGTQPPSKRRKLSQTSAEPLQQSNRNEQSGRESSQQLRSPGPVFTIVEEPAIETQDEVFDDRLNVSTVPTSPLFFPDGEGNKENSDLQNGTIEPIPTPSKRTSDDQENMQKRTRLSRTTSILSNTPPVESQDLEGELEETGHDNDITNLPSASTAKTGRQSELPEPLTQIRSTSIDASKRTTKKRKKRKSVVLGRKKRRSSGNNSVLSLQPEENSRAETPVSLDSENPGSQSEPDNEEIHDDTSTNVEEVPQALPNGRRIYARDRLKGTRQERRSSMASVDPDAAEPNNEEGDETYLPDENSPQPTPAPIRKRGTSKRVSDASTTSSNSQRSRKSTYPVQVYRMNNAHTLPTITEEEGNNSDSDNVRAGIPSTISTRTAPNGVDVLAQLCHETIATAISKLQQNNDPTLSRADLKRKTSALEAFSSDLASRLFDMSEAVEHRLTLETRLRKSRREKQDLQARWMEVRRQRDRLALRTDAIRRRHWEDEEDWRRRWEVSEVAHRTELESERSLQIGEGEQRAADLEFLVRDVAASVSSRGESGGILDRVKAFNMQLETIATALERKK